MAKEYDQEAELQAAAEDMDTETGNGADKATVGETPPERDESEDLRQQLEAARAKLAEQQEAALRAHAELDNLRKRTLRDVENAHKFALDRFISELLPVLDSMELGIAAADSSGDADSLREGMDLTLRKFQDTLAKFGVSVIDPIGEKFNPERHEAVSMQEIAGSAAGTVVTVMQKGYELNGRLVRPAMVVVAK